MDNTAEHELAEAVIGERQICCKNFCSTEINILDFFFA